MTVLFSEYGGAPILSRINYAGRYGVPVELAEFVHRVTHVGGATESSVEYPVSLECEADTRWVECVARFVEQTHGCWVACDGDDVSLAVFDREGSYEGQCVEGGVLSALVGASVNVVNNHYSRVHPSVSIVFKWGSYEEFFGFTFRWRDERCAYESVLLPVPHKNTISDVSRSDGQVGEIPFLRHFFGEEVIDRFVLFTLRRNLDRAGWTFPVILEGSVLAQLCAPFIDGNDSSE